MEMEGTDDDSVEQEDPREWSPQKVASFCADSRLHTSSVLVSPVL